MLSKMPHVQSILTACFWSLREPQYLLLFASRYDGTCLIFPAWSLVRITCPYPSFEFLISPLGQWLPLLWISRQFLCHLLASTCSGISIWHFLTYLVLVQQVLCQAHSLFTTLSAYPYHFPWKLFTRQHSIWVLILCIPLSPRCDVSHYFPRFFILVYR